MITAYVGATGLIARMSFDLSMPSFLLSRSSLTGTYHWIIFGLFVLYTGVYHACKENAKSMLEVFSIAFSFSLLLFAVACLVLKFRMPHLLPRLPWWRLVLALLSVTVTLVASAIYKSQSVFIFLAYTAAIGLLVFLTMRRDVICGSVAQSHFRSDTMIFFVKNADRDVLAGGIEYIWQNQATASKIALVHCTGVSRRTTNTLGGIGMSEAKNSSITANTSIIEANKGMNPDTEQILNLANEIVPDWMNLDVRVIQVQAPFTPDVVLRCSQELRVHNAFVFMSCPGPNFKHSIKDIGARIITTRRGSARDAVIE